MSQNNESTTPGSLNPGDFGAAGTMSTGVNVTAQPKNFGATNTAQVQAQVNDVQVQGNPDAWKVVCKASSQSQRWMKSTKIMELRDHNTKKLRGCLVQVTTQQGDQVAEALQFVPGVCAEDFGV